MKPKRTESARPRAAAAARPEASKMSEDRSAYRRSAPAGGDKKADVGAGANPNLEFVSLLVPICQVTCIDSVLLFPYREADTDAVVAQHPNERVIFEEG